MFNVMIDQKRESRFELVSGRYEKRFASRNIKHGIISTPIPSRSGRFARRLPRSRPCFPSPLTSAKVRLLYQRECGEICAGGLVGKAPDLLLEEKRF